MLHAWIALFKSLFAKTHFARAPSPEKLTSLDNPEQKRQPLHRRLQCPRHAVTARLGHAFGHECTPDAAAAI